MASALEEIQKVIRTLKLDDSLLFLNHLFAVARGERQDPVVDQVVRSRKAKAPAFVVHFLAKHLLLHGSCHKPPREPSANAPYPRTPAAFICDCAHNDATAWHAWRVHGLGANADIGTSNVAGVTRPSFQSGIDSVSRALPSPGSFGARTEPKKRQVQNSQHTLRTRKGSPPSFAGNTASTTVLTAPGLANCSE